MDGAYKTNGISNNEYESGSINLDKMNGDIPSITKTNGISNNDYESGPTKLDKVNGDIPSTSKDPPKRDQWGNGVEFLMSCIAATMGLGNIWRFPFVAYKYGGGTFIILYLIVDSLIGRPMFLMEMALGQFSSRGSFKMFEKLSPLLKGIGYGQLIGVFCVSTYYCSIMAITLFYLINSFTTYFPWINCRDSWEEYASERNLTCVGQNTNASDIPHNGTISASELYFKIEVLKEIDDISEGIGTPDWKLSLLLLISWLVVYLVTIRGVKSSGKAAYFLAIFPYIIMITLLIRAATLEGAASGMYYFIKTDWKRLLEAEVWYAAVTQCFFSLNVGFGEIIMFSSYNRFSHNINRDALIVTTLDTFTSLLSGITIFGILGNLAHHMNVDPSEVISNGGGTGLAFISYPDAIAKFEHVPWLFGLSFFFMLFVLGVGSQAALHGAMNTAIKDIFPNFAHWKIAACTGIASFLIGLIYTTPGGQYMLDLIDHFGGTLVIFPFVILEVTAVAWLYGIDQFCLDLEFMTKEKVGLYWRVSWGVLMPGLLIVVFLYFLSTLQPLRYGIYDLLYPIHLTVIGWSIFALGLTQMVFWVAYYLYAHREYPAKKMVTKSFSTKTWSPENDQIAKIGESSKKTSSVREVQEKAPGLREQPKL